MPGEPVPEVLPEPFGLGLLSTTVAEQPPRANAQARVMPQANAGAQESVLSSMFLLQQVIIFVVPVFGFRRYRDHNAHPNGVGLRSHSLQRRARA